MQKRIKTSTSTAVNLEKLDKFLRLSSKAAILRIAISRSLQDVSIPKMDMKENKNGFEISLDTLFGEYGIFYKVLIKRHANQDLSDEAFVNLVIAHIERGMITLYGDYALDNNKNKLFLRLIEEDKV